jgi:alanine racemase
MTRLVIQLDEDAVRHNFKLVRQLAPGAAIMSILKANAYGHGLIPMARLFLRAGTEQFGVATPNEAIELRASGISEPILLLSPAPFEAHHDLVSAGISMMVSTDEAGLAISRMSEDLSVAKPTDVHVKIDIGLGRYGFSPGPATVDSIVRLAALPKIRVTSIYSHLPSSDRDQALNQLAAFNNLYRQLGPALGYWPTRHLLASAGLAVGLHSIAPMDSVRPGMLLYGQHLTYGSELPSIQVRPVITVSSYFAEIRSIPPGGSVGYPPARRLDRPSLIGTLPVGFADGIPWAIAGKGRVLVKGRFLPILAIGATHSCVDVTEVPDVTTGDQVVLLGAQGPARIDLTEWTAATKSINTELLTRLSPTAQRIIGGALE